MNIEERMDTNRKVDPRGKEFMNRLIESLRELLETTGNCRGVREILLLCSRCYSRKGKALRTVARFLKKRFQDKLEILSIKLEEYSKLDDTSEMVDGLIHTINKAYNTSTSQKSTASTLPSLDIVEDMREFLSIFKSVKAEAIITTKCIFPINKKVFFLDKKVDYPRYISSKMIHRVFMRNIEGLNIFLKNCLLISRKVIDETLKRNEANIPDKKPIDQFLGDIKHFLSILKTHGLKYKILEKSESTLADLDISFLKPIQHKFSDVFEYFKNQSYVYPRKFQRKIEEKVLSSLYSETELEYISNEILNLDQCHSIYSIFVRAGLKEKLLESFSLILPEKIVSSASSFVTFVGLYAKCKEILTIFQDPEFDALVEKYIQRILDIPGNCIGITGFVDSVMNNKVLAVKDSNFVDGEDCSPAILEAFDLIVELVDKCKNPEFFLKTLQDKLAFRLLSMRNSSDPSQEIEKETLFLKRLERMYSGNMLRMIDDFNGSRNGILAMTMCKWPVFKTGDVPIPDEHQIVIAKRRFEEEFRADRKKISWIDSLATVTVVLYEKTITLSLFQYSVILRIIQKGKFIDVNKENQGENKMIAIESGEIQISKCYVSQFERLKDDLVIMIGDQIVLNSFFTKTNYLGFKIEFESEFGEEEDDVGYNLKIYNEARVAKTLKKSKSVSVSELLVAVGGIEISELNECLSVLEKKGICEVSGNSVRYCP